MSYEEEEEVEGFKEDMDLDEPLDDMPDMDFGLDEEDPDRDS